MIEATVLIAASMFAGNVSGVLLGRLFGQNINIGGIGFSVIFLLLFSHILKKHRLFSEKLEQGMRFWKELYVMAIIAVAASQDVYSALSKGIIAVLAGSVPVFLVIGIAAIWAHRNRNRG